MKVKTLLFCYCGLKKLENQYIEFNKETINSALKQIREICEINENTTIELRGFIDSTELEFKIYIEDGNGNDIYAGIMEIKE